MFIPKVHVTTIAIAIIHYTSRLPKNRLIISIIRHKMYMHIRDVYIRRVYPICKRDREIQSP